MADDSYETYSVGETSLVNVKNASEDDWSVYVGRANSYYSLPQSEFANPFKLDDYSRDESVDLYTLWFTYRVTHDAAFRDAATELQGETLACWCVPERCHGMVLVEYVENGVVGSDELSRIVENHETESLPGISEEVQATIAQAVDWVQSQS